jgi:hypothetical protein
VICHEERVSLDMGTELVSQKNIARPEAVVVQVRAGGETCGVAPS